MKTIVTNKVPEQRYAVGFRYSGQIGMVYGPYKKLSEALADTADPEATGEHDWVIVKTPPETILYEWDETNTQWVKPATAKVGPKRNSAQATALRSELEESIDAAARSINDENWKNDANRIGQSLVGHWDAGTTIAQADLPTLRKWLQELERKNTNALKKMAQIRVTT